MTLKYVSYLLKVLFFVFPDKDERKTLESIDKREEEIMNEVVVMYGVEIVDISHEVNEDLTELVLAIGIDACILKEIKEKFHGVIVVFDEYTGATFEKVDNYNGSSDLEDFLSTFGIKDKGWHQLNKTERLLENSIGILISFQSGSKFFNQT